MPHFIVNRDPQPHGDHEVHRTDTCARLPNAENQMALGWYECCRQAVAAAKGIGYERATGCQLCIPECRTT